MGWVGLGRVRSNMNYCQTALILGVERFNYEFKIELLTK